RIQGQGRTPGSAHRRCHRCRDGARSTWRPQIRQQGEHDSRGDRQNHQYDDGGQEIRTVPLVLVEFRSVGQSDGVGRGGDPVDVVAGGDRRQGARHPVRVPALAGRLSGLGLHAGADEASRRPQARLLLRIHELVHLGFPGRVHRPPGLLLIGPKKFLSEAEWDYWYGGKPAAADITDPYGKLMEKAGNTRDGGAFWDRMGNIAVWNSVMDEDRYLTRRWNEFITS